MTWGRETRHMKASASLRIIFFNCILKSWISPRSFNLSTFIQLSHCIFVSSTHLHYSIFDLKTETILLKLYSLWAALVILHCTATFAFFFFFYLPYILPYNYHFNFVSFTFTFTFYTNVLTWNISKNRKVLLVWRLNRWLSLLLS